MRLLTSFENEARQKPRLVRTLPAMVTTRQPNLLASVATTGPTTTDPLQDLRQQTHYRTYDNRPTTGPTTTHPLQDLRQQTHYRTYDNRPTTGPTTTDPLQDLRQHTHYRTYDTYVNTPCFDTCGPHVTWIRRHMTRHHRTPHDSTRHHSTRHDITTHHTAPLTHKAVS